MVVSGVGGPGLPGSGIVALDKGDETFDEGGEKETFEKNFTQSHNFFFQILQFSFKKCSSDSNVASVLQILRIYWTNSSNTARLFQTLY